MKLISNDIWWRHMFQCNQALSLFSVWGPYKFSTRCTIRSEEAESGKKCGKDAREKLIWEESLRFPPKKANKKGIINLRIINYKLTKCMHPLLHPVIFKINFGKQQRNRKSKIEFPLWSALVLFRKFWECMESCGFSHLHSAPPNLSSTNPWTFRARLHWNVWCHHTSF